MNFRWISYLLLASCLSGCSLFSPPKTQVDTEKLFLGDNPKRKNLRDGYSDLLNPLRDQILLAESKGEEVTCLYQILDEAHWLLESTTQYKRIQSRIRDFKYELALPSAKRHRDYQSSDDGSWGRCYQEWFFKLSASYDHLAELQRHNRPPKYPPSFLNRVNSSQKLWTYLNSLLISDPAKKTTDHRRELYELVSSLLPMVQRKIPVDFTWAPGVREELQDFIFKKWLDRRTHYWGEWYRDGSDLIKSTDLGLTYEIARNLPGDINDWGDLLSWTLKIKDDAYPRGWVDDGQMSNRVNMQLVTLFNLGWTHASSSQKQEMKSEIEKMLNWCLHESYLPDGSFRVPTNEFSTEREYYYAAAFLSRIGYFNPQRRFWTSEDFPDSLGLRTTLISRIHTYLSTGSGPGFYYHAALREMEAE